VAGATADEFMLRVLPNRGLVAEAESLLLDGLINGQSCPSILGKRHTQENANSSRRRDRDIGRHVRIAARNVTAILLPNRYQTQSVRKKVSGGYFGGDK
jgi:hypothetical protein